jgi:hypothetical protein
MRPPSIWVISLISLALIGKRSLKVLSSNTIIFRLTSSGLLLVHTWGLPVLDEATDSHGFLLEGRYQRC